MEGSLERLAAQAAALGASPSAEQLEGLRAASAAALAAARARGTLGAAQQKQLFEAACTLWNASIEMDGGGAAAGEEATVEEGATDGGDEWRRTVAAVLQAACDLCSLVNLSALLPTDAANLVRFHHRAGQAWAALGEYEAAEAALSRGGEAAAGLSAAAFEARGRAPHHQDCAALLFSLLLERARVALHLGQQMLASELVGRAQAFAADQRLPAAEALACWLALVRMLREQGLRLAQAGQPSAAAPLLSAAYQALSQLDLGEGAEPELAAAAGEAHAAAGQVLSLLAWCNLECGEAEQALACVQALRQLGEAAGAGAGGAHTHFAAAFLSLRVLLQLGRLGEAEAELTALVSHEEVTPEACLAALQAALAAPGGVPLARCALPLVLERFADEPGVAVELARAALQTAAGGPPVNGGNAAGGCGEADAQGVAAAEARAEAEALVLELVGDERLAERLQEAGLRQAVLGLVWNHAVAALHSGAAFHSALSFFSAALPLMGAAGGSAAATQAEGSAGGGEAEAPGPAACHRAQALCCMGLGQHDRALEHLAQAEQGEPGAVPTAMLRLSAQLQAGSGEGAADALASLAACPGADPDVLRIACCQCTDAGASGAARTALRLLLQRCAGEGGSGDGGQGGDGPDQAPATGPGAPAYEATVFANLIRLLLPQPGGGAAQGGADAEGDSPMPDGAAVAPAMQEAASSAELATVFDGLVERMRAVGPARFFAHAEGRPAQQEWLAQQAWNAGLSAGSAGDLETAAVLLAVCGELHTALPAPTPAALHKQKMAFLMASAMAADVHEQRAAEKTPEDAAAAAADPATAHSVALARAYLAAARRAAAALADARADAAGERGGCGQVGGDAKSDVYLLLLDFKLCWLCSDAPGQLAVLQAAQALPAFGAEHFAMAAGLARGGSGASPAAAPRCPEVCRAAEAARLQRLTQKAPLDYAAAAACLRTLLELTPADADKLGLLEEAAGLLAAAPAGAYPAQELRWLVTTAWNRGALHARFGRAAEAQRFQGWAAGALRHAPQLAAQYQELMRGELALTAQEAQRRGGAGSTAAEPLAGLA